MAQGPAAPIQLLEEKKRMRSPSRRRFLANTTALAAAGSFSPLALAQEKPLTIGMAAPPTTLDPHLQSSAPNNAVAMHIYDALVTNDAKSQSKPGLASSWRLIDDTTWEFTLNPKAVFSDGSPLTGEDVIASIKRVGVLTSVAPFTTYTRSIADMSVPGPGKLIIKTHQPDPLLLNSLSRVRIISQKYAQSPSADFNSGKAAIGTGPYLLKEYVPESRVVLVRNPHYWGPKPQFENFVLRIVTDPGARLAALLGGDCDLIETVPSEGITRVQQSGNKHIIRGVSSRMVYMTMDEGRDVTPFATDKSGKPLPKNPFKDERVRLAFAKAINRDLIISRVMQGNAVAADQYVQPGTFGASTKIKPVAYDPKGAKALLAQAGYPDGFKLTIHSSNNRYINDAAIAQAVAQFLTRIGIETTVDVMPWSVYAPHVSKGEYSFMLGSWGTNTGETSNPLLGTAVSFDAKAGTGASNYGRYSNPELDKLVLEAKSTMDDKKREALLAQACEIVFDNHVLLPLHNEVLVLAARKGISYETRVDQYTLAMGITKA